MNPEPTDPSAPASLTVFVSSPGDVAEERLIAKRVLDRLTVEFAPIAALEAIFWEHEPLLASDTFQAQLVRPSQTDIVICILWSRLGTRLPKEFKHPDGSPYNSGTEFEFEDALEGRQQHGRPDLLIYRKTAESLVSLKDMESARAAFEQREMLDEFVQRYFHGEDGTLIAAFHPFENAADFETRLEDHLRKLIRDRLGALGATEGQTPIRPTWTQGCPFRGLNVFEFEHHAIFFGRTRAIGEALDRLKRQAAEGHAFLLILGTSGCGKSSLVLAGVLPLLVQPSVVEGVGLWRRAIVRPGERSGDLFDGLAAALLRPDALPELISDGTTVEQLARMLRMAPEAASLLIKGAISQAASKLHKAESSPVQPTARLVLVLDQFEELFTAADLSNEHRSAFFAAIRSLAEAGHTWVIATLRSDFYHRAAEIPALVELKSGFGQYDLPPPDSSEIAQLVRRPAFAAGLRFEVDMQTGDQLDDLLRDAATLNRDSLPLVEFTLDELYRRRSGNVLTLAAYRELGGMEGALARRADEVFAALPEASKSSLAHVFRQLVTLGEDETATPTRKQAPASAFEIGTPARQLVDAFVAARLLTGKRTDDETPVVEISHESLLSRWQPLVDWLAHDRELLRIRSRVGAAAARWAQENRRADLLLQTGKPLDEGLQLHAAGFALNSFKREFIASSAAADRRRVKLRRAIVVALSGLTVAALAGALVANFMRLRANDSETAAITAKNDAQEASKRANQQRLIAEVQRIASDAVSARLQGYPQRSLLLAIEAVRTNRTGAEPPAVAAEQSLRDSLASAGGRGCGYQYARMASVETELTSDGHWLIATTYPEDRIASANLADMNVWLWNRTAPGLPPVPVVLCGDQHEVSSIKTSSDGHWIATVSKDRLKATLWDLHQSDPSVHPVELGGTGEIDVVAFSPNGRWLALGNGDKTARLFDLAAADPSAVSATLAGHDDAVYYVQFSADSRWLATSGGSSLRLWDLKAADPGSRGITIRAAEKDVRSEAFDPKCRWLATGCQDKQVRLWSLAAADPGQQPISLAGHSEAVSEIAFSPDGRWLASRSSDNQAKLWDLNAADPATASHNLTGPSDSVDTLRFSPDGSWLATRNDSYVLGIWNLRASDPTSKHISLGAAGGGDERSELAFSPDGRWISDTAHLWDLKSADPASHPVLLGGADDSSWSIAFSPSGDRLATGNWDKSVRIWNLKQSKMPLKPTIYRGHDGEVDSVKFSGDGKWLASGATDGSARLWDVEASGPTIQPLVIHGPKTYFVGLSYSADGRWLVTSSGDGTSSLRLSASGSASASPVKPILLSDAQGMGNAMAISPKSDRLATTGETTAMVWNLDSADPRTAPLVLKGHEKRVVSAAFGPDGLTLATGSDDNTARLWDLQAKDPNTACLVFRGHRDTINSVAVSPDGRWLATGSEVSSARLWDLKASDPTSKPIVIDGFEKSIKDDSNVYDTKTTVAFSPDGRWFAASGGKTCKLVDLAASPVAARPILLAGHIGAIVSLVFSPDSHRLATGSHDSTARVWDLRANDPASQPLVLVGHEAWVDMVAFSPDGNSLATGSLDKTARLWDLTSTDPSRTSLVFRGAEQDVNRVAFSPDGGRLAVASEDGLLQIWRTKTDDLIQLARPVIGRNLTRDEWSQYFPDIVYHKTFDDLPDPEAASK